MCDKNSRIENKTLIELTCLKHNCVNENQSPVKVTIITLLDVLNLFNDLDIEIHFHCSGMFIKEIGGLPPEFNCTGIYWNTKHFELDNQGNKVLQFIADEIRSQGE